MYSAEQRQSCSELFKVHNLHYCISFPHSQGSVIAKPCLHTKLSVVEAGVSPRNGWQHTGVRVKAGQGGDEWQGQPRPRHHDGQALQLHHCRHRSQPDQQEVLPGPGPGDPACEGGGGDQDHGDGDITAQHQGGTQTHTTLPGHTLLHSRWEPWSI